MLVKLVGFCALLAICSAERLPVTVYYEALCPDSARAFVEQIHPVKSSPLGRFIELILVPFGKASYKTLGSDVEFTCQHGPNECYGNKVHACAIEHIQVNSYQNTKTKESLTLDYVTCLMQTAINFKDSIFPGVKCARDLQLPNWQVIEECANSTQGSKLLQNYGEKTKLLDPPLTSVPTVTFNHQFDRSENDFALRDLRSAACRVMREPKPYECFNLPNSAINNAAAMITVLLATTFVAFTKLF